MQQIGLKKISGQIVVKTGLHIGAGSDKVEIGGMDNPVIRNPLTREPYIPGSSLKGKMRSLLEWKLDKVQNKGGNPCSCGRTDCPVCRVFGSANNSRGKGEEDQNGPTRLIVRDAFLSEEDREKMNNGKAIIEEKYENSLNRITARANPRPIERVVPGVKFDFEMIYRIIDTNDGGKTDETNFNRVVLEALKLLKNDYLGGGGTRGNGRIDFINVKDETGKAIDL
jgi:CRISPR-associated protein Csm3